MSKRRAAEAPWMYLQVLRSQDASMTHHVMVGAKIER